MSPSSNSRKLRASALDLARRVASKRFRSCVQVESRGDVCGAARRFGLGRPSPVSGARLPCPDRGGTFPVGRGGLPSEVRLFAATSPLGRSCKTSAHLISMLNSDIDPKTITRLLHAASEGRGEAAEALMPMVYGELRAIAASLFRSERDGHTLQPTALVNEAWIKVSTYLEGSEGQLGCRRHFYTLSSRAMRQVLADHARAAKSLKRGDGRLQVSLEPSRTASEAGSFDLIDLQDALERLSALNERHSSVVELRVFGGLTIAETAIELRVSEATVERDWVYVRAWLRRELGQVA